MSAIGQILDQVRDIVEGALSKVHARDKAQDERLDALEARVKVLEDEASPPAAAAKKTVAPKAGTAGTRAAAPDSK